MKIFTLKSVAVGLVVAGLAMVPAFASAQTVSASATTSVSALEAQVAALLSQLAALRGELGPAEATSTMMPGASDMPGMPGMPGMMEGSQPTGTPPGATPPNAMMPGDQDMRGSMPGGSGMTESMPGEMMATGTVNSNVIVHGYGMPMASSTMICPIISRNLSLGSQGSDVSQLQSMLAQDPSVYPQGNVTGYFGPLTAQAVIRFQEKNAIASSTAGFFGPLSRKFLSNQCGMGGMHPMPMMGTSTMMEMHGTSTMMMGTSTSNHF